MERIFIKTSAMEQIELAEHRISELERRIAQHVADNAELTEILDGVLGEFVGDEAQLEMPYTKRAAAAIARHRERQGKD